MTGPDQSGDCIARVADTGDRLQVVTNRRIELAKPGSTNVLTNQYGDLFVIAEDDDTVRVGTAAHACGTDGWFIHGANGIYAEVPLVERELTDAEVEWCESTIMYSGDGRPETVVEFEIPAPEDLRAAIRAQDCTAFDCLDAVIEDDARRHTVLTELQERIAEEGVRRTKLRSRKGYPIDLLPEWDPDNDHNRDRDAKHLYDMVSMRRDAHLADFKAIAGFSYSVWFSARARVLGVHEPRLDDHDLVALDVAGYDDWTYCRTCAAVAPDDRFLHPERRGADGQTIRMCDDCAERRTYGLVDEDAVAAAQDERAQRLGGQRRIGGEY